MSKPVWIYGLCDPDTKEVRYIGKTVNLRERYRAHLRRARQGHNPHVYAWIRSLLKKGKMPLMQIMVCCDEATWPLFERIKIENTPNLTNMAPGGEGIAPEVQACNAAARAVKCIVTFPDGSERVIRNLTRFCEEHGITVPNAFKVLWGKRHVAQGYKFRYVGEPPRERPARWEITFPDGRVERCRNLTAWAREHGYGLNRIYAAAQGKQPHYAGLEIRGLA